MEKDLITTLTTKKDGFKCLLSDKRKHLCKVLLSAKETNIVIEFLRQTADKKESTADHQTVFALRFKILPLYSSTQKEMNIIGNKACAEHMLQLFSITWGLNDFSIVGFKELWNSL